MNGASAWTDVEVVFPAYKEPLVAGGFTAGIAGCVYVLNDALKNEWTIYPAARGRRLT